jgi:hypothetical protein
MGSFGCRPPRNGRVFFRQSQFNIGSAAPGMLRGIKPQAPKDVLTGVNPFAYGLK